MRYARLGDTGLVVSRLSFGSMTFGSGQGPMGHVWRTGQKEATALVGRCLDAGVNLFDSADMYAAGESERMLGKALGTRRGEVALSTKAGFRASRSHLRTGLSARHLIAQCEGSLERLGTDWVDLFIVHRLDPFTPLEETLRALEDLVRSGKVRYLGYSNWPAWKAGLAVATQRERRWTPFSAAQMYYSLVGRDVERDTVALLREAGIGMMVWSPLAGGFLSGRYTRKDPTGGGGRLAEFDFLPTERERGWKLIDAMSAIAKRRGASVAQVALAWLLSKPWAATIVLGASKLSQLDDNLAAADLALAADEAAKLDELTAPLNLYPEWFNEKTADAAIREALGVASQ
ncbi:MAG: aldo/keto reductase [Elusimicrobia bacterium]|nr:aldo/keto reductase [Elusimicrobiota bacterium]